MKIPSRSPTREVQHGENNRLQQLCRIGSRRQFPRRFFTIPDHDRDTGAQLWRYPGTAGQTKKEFTMMGYGNGMGSLGWLGMGVFWLILLGLIVWLVMRLLPGSSGRTTRPTGESALGILDRRLANGEIDTPEWQTQRAALLAATGDRQ